MVGFVLAWRLVPTLPTSTHRFDWLGVALSGVGMFLLVFGIQEGHQYDWGTITGIVTVPLLIVGGLVVFALFIGWQARNPREPLVPLSLFRDRNFSLANLAISAMSFAITALAFPLMLYAQLVRGLSPTESALLLVPMAMMSIVLAPLVGRAHRLRAPPVDHRGRVLLRDRLAGLAEPGDETRLLHLGDPAADGLLGVGNACVWAPTSATATRNLPMHRAGAGAGVYNATRQVGAVLGSAAIAVLMDSRLSAQGLNFAPSEAGGGHAPASRCSSRSATRCRSRCSCRPPCSCSASSQRSPTPARSTSCVRLLRRPRRRRRRSACKRL